MGRRSGSEKLDDRPDNPGHDGNDDEHGNAQEDLKPAPVPLLGAGQHPCH